MNYVRNGKSGLALVSARDGKRNWLATDLRYPPRKSQCYHRLADCVSIVTVSLTSIRMALQVMRLSRLVNEDNV